MRFALLPLSPINLNHPGRYVHWGVIQISVANLVLILLMVLLFAAAILLPFPGTTAAEVTAVPDAPEDTSAAQEETGGWTGVGASPRAAQLPA